MKTYEKKKEKIASQPELHGAQYTEGLPNSMYATVMSASDGSPASGAPDPDLLGKIRSRPVNIPEQLSGSISSRLGVDLGSTKVFETPDLEPSLGESAVTRGSEIYFQQGKYSPHTGTGQKMLMHEMTHVAQQGLGLVHGTGPVSDSSLETAADSGSLGGISTAGFSMPSAGAAAPMQGLSALRRFFNWFTKSGRKRNREADEKKKQQQQIEQKANMHPGQIPPTENMKIAAGAIAAMQQQAAAPPVAPHAAANAPRQLDQNEATIRELSGDSDDAGALQRLSAAHRGLAEPWLNALSSTERNNITLYTGPAYGAINKTLRNLQGAQEEREAAARGQRNVFFNNEVISGEVLGTVEGVNEVSGNISRALRKNRTTVDFTVYRGMGMNVLESWLEHFNAADLAKGRLIDPATGLPQDREETTGEAIAANSAQIKSVLEGKLVSDPGFISTSIDKSKAEGFAGFQGPHRPGHMMEIRIPANSKGAGYITPISVFDEQEREFLIDKNAVFHIDNVEINTEAGSDLRGRLSIKATLMAEEGERR